MIILKEWNQVLQYARKVSEENNIFYSQYEMYDGRKGLYLFEKDIDGKVHGSGWATGTHSSKDGYINAINQFVNNL